MNNDVKYLTNLQRLEVIVMETFEVRYSSLIEAESAEEARLIAEIELYRNKLNSWEIEAYACY